MSTAPDIGVVVVTHNSRDVVLELLDSLPGALDGLAAQTVVVDNGSTDDTVAVVSARSDCTVVPAANRGYSAGINRGVRELPPGIPVLVLNPDVRLGPGSVRTMAATLRLDRVGIVAPRILEPDGALTRSVRREPTLARALGLAFTRHPALTEQVTDLESYRAPIVVGWATGAVLLVARRCHDALGGWDESYFMYSEEADFSLRARDKGWLTVFEPAASAVHVGAQSGWSDRLYTMQIVNRVRLYRRRHGLPASVLFYVMSILREVNLSRRGERQARAALRALVVPSARPVELGCSTRLVPR